MSEKNIRNGKVFNFFDWVWRLMVLNVLTLVFSLGIITIMPAICASFKTIKDTKENYNSKIFKPFIVNFAYLFRDTFAFSIILVAMIGISGFAFLFYDGVIGVTAGSEASMDQTWYVIGIISIVVVVVGISLVSMALIQLPMVINYFYMIQILYHFPKHNSLNLFVDNLKQHQLNQDLNLLFLIYLLYFFFAIY